MSVEVEVAQHEPVKESVTRTPPSATPGYVISAVTIPDVSTTTNQGLPHPSFASFAKQGGHFEVTTASAQCEAQSATAKARRRALILPREHGAWGLLLVPMITAAGVAFREIQMPETWVRETWVPETWVPHVSPLLRDMGSVVPILSFLLLLTAALALFWLRTPIESLLGTTPMRAQSNAERRTVLRAIALLGTIAVLALTTLLWSGRNPYLWLIGAAAGAAFAAQALLKLMWRRPPRPSRESLPRTSVASRGGEAERPRSQHSPHNLRMLSEIVGTIGLTASAPAAYYVITGKLGPTAITLWLANLLFAGNQIHYVQLRIHTAKLEGLRSKLAHGWRFATGQALMTVALAVAGVGSLIPPLTTLAFAPLLFRGWFYFIQPPAPLQVRRLGWTELAHAITFCALFIATN